MPLSNLSIASKKIIATRIICIFWLMAKIMSYKLWLATRLFPVVPPFNFLFVPSLIHLMLFVFSLAAIFALLIFPSKRKLQLSVIIVEVLSCLLDQSRWQPWEYQYIFIILALFINYNRDKRTISSICFIFISIYIFSGIGKMNFAFSRNLQYEIIHSGIIHLHNYYLYNLIMFHLGPILGIIEIFSGIGLLFHTTKKIAATLLIVMHLIILTILGPFGTNYDKIIWPWNIAMILVLYIFFIRNEPVSIIFQSKGWNKLIIVFFGILPFLNFFGCWDFFLSFSLFSYKAPLMYVCIHKEGSGKELQPFFDAYNNKFLCDSNSKSLTITEWSHQEMLVPPYPELRVYRKIKVQLLHRYPDMSADFIVYQYIKGQIVRMELK